MTSQQAFRDNSKPLTSYQTSIMDAYVATHDPSRVQGYVDGVADVVEYLETRILMNVQGNFRPLSKDQIQLELEQLCRLAKEMIQATASTGPTTTVLQIPQQD